MVNVSEFNLLIDNDDVIIIEFKLEDRDLLFKLLLFIIIFVSFDLFVVFGLFKKASGVNKTVLFVKLIPKGPDVIILLVLLLISVFLDNWLSDSMVSSDDDNVVASVVAVVGINEWINLIWDDELDDESGNNWFRIVCVSSFENDNDAVFFCLKNRK